MPTEVVSRAVTVGANARTQTPYLGEQPVSIEAIQIVIDVHNRQDRTPSGRSRSPGKPTRTSRLSVPLAAQIDVAEPWRVSWSVVGDGEVELA